jgi:hypothetical protein
MYTKKILSAAAAVAVLSTGLMAFESNSNGLIRVTSYTNPDGTVTNQEVNGSYKDGNLTNALELSADQRGDALIYPYYSVAKSATQPAWGTEIVVRNTTRKATVAKVVLYASTDSEEIRDFNIYLSPLDVFRFTIEAGEGDDQEKILIKTNDGSFPTSVRDPRWGTANDDAVFNTHNQGDPETILKFPKIANYETGYVAIYGMTQYSKDDIFHDKHKEMFLDYRRVLDDCREDWRDAFKLTQAGHPARVDSMFALTDKNITAPNVAVGCAIDDLNGSISNTDSNSSLAEANLSNWGDVNETTLVGTVRIANPGATPDGTQARDLILPATALANFTDGTMMLWSEGEYAAIQDRDIENGKYVKANVLTDAKAFANKTAFYTFSSDLGEDGEEKIANALIVTQPHKRVLALNFNDTTYWNSSKKFTVSAQLLDEDENFDKASPEDMGMTEIFSGPGSTNTSIVQGGYPNEVEVLRNIERVTTEDGGIAATSNFTNKSGFAYLNFNTDITDSNSTLPAIVTQMVGSKVNGVSQTNWIYAPVVK